MPAECISSVWVGCGFDSGFGGGFGGGGGVGTGSELLQVHAQVAQHLGQLLPQDGAVYVALDELGISSEVLQTRARYEFFPRQKHSLEPLPVEAPCASPLIPTCLPLSVVATCVESGLSPVALMPRLRQASVSWICENS